ncbi:hypothetical protein E0W60_29990 (plasmid) [Cupriavidus oxalaticus]|uniref:Uncharacterized protein n=1 Tax=Cupriavidus oxalaticus TaxID=96344 RepID=A0A4P7LI43_9BURK|nr:hypothetical protein E0W60_29990 [Cupriavidus oxalaticus]
MDPADRCRPLTEYWGRSDLASSDMMSLETASIGMYTHVRDRWGIFYDQPILLNERQAGCWGQLSGE